MAQQKGTIIIEHPYYGWITTMQSGGITHGLEGPFVYAESYSGYQQYTGSVAMMPNRPGYEGHLAPAPAFTAATDGSSVVNGLAINSVIESDGQCYVALDSNRYVTLSSLSAPAVSQTVYGTVGLMVGYHSGHTMPTTVNGDVAGFPAVIGSTVAYSGGTAYAYFSWEDNTDGDIAQYCGTSGTSNYYTGIGGVALTNNLPHPLFNFGDKFIYCGNGQTLIQFSPSLGTFNNQALILPPQWVIQHIVQYQNFIAIAAWKANNPITTNSTIMPSDKGQTALFLWDGFSGTFNFQYDIQDFYVSNLFYDGTNLYAITFGRNGTVKLKQFNGQSFDILFESANIGNTPGGTNSITPCFGALDIWLNQLTWTTAGGGNINMYGSADAENLPPGFHQVGTVNANNGMAKNLYGNTLFVGNRVNSSSYKILYSDFTKFDNQGDKFFSGFHALPTNSTIDYVKMYFSQWGTGAAMLASIYKDYTLIGSSGGDQLNWQPTWLTQGTNVSYAYISRSIKNVNGFYMGLQWNHANLTDTAAIIRKVEIGYNWDDDNI